MTRSARPDDPGGGGQRHPGPHLPAQPAESQPLLGLAGLTFVVPFFFLLASALGGAEPSLLVLGPLTTFALPVIATVAFWWQDWPGSRLRPGWSGLTDTVVIGVGAVVLTILGQAVTSRVDLRGIFDPDPGPGHPPTFPVTLALGAAAFTIILHLTLVCEGWPVRRLGWFRGGVVALVFSVAIAVVAYLLLVNLDDVPAALRAAQRLRNPGGPVPIATYSAVLLLLGVWQVLLFVSLRGWPLTLIRRSGVRLAARNAAVVAGTVASFPLLWWATGGDVDRVNAVCGVLIAAALLVSMLFDNWPATRLHGWAVHLGVLPLVAAVAVVLYLALSAYADGIDWTRTTADGWVALAALNYLSLGVVVHVAVWRRWPVLLTAAR